MVVGDLKKINLDPPDGTRHNESEGVVSAEVVSITKAMQEYQKLLYVSDQLECLAAPLRAPFCGDSGFCR